MRQIGLCFGLLALLFQNLVFWQMAMPKSMQSNMICAQISAALDQMPSNMSHHDNMMMPDEHAHAQIHSKQQHDDMLQHCHFCQLYHQLSALPEINLDLIETKILVRLIVFASLAYVFFYLRRLFLCPQGRAPPTQLCFA